jgi:hypothetical protein
MSYLATGQFINSDIIDRNLQKKHIENFVNLDENSLNNNNRATWSYYDKMCKDKGARLCNSNEICPRAGGDPIFDDRFNDMDNWIAIGDKASNGKQGDWITIGNSQMPERKCKSHVQNGFGYPGWGENKDGTWVRGAKCCAPKN